MRWFSCGVGIKKIYSSATVIDTLTDPKLASYSKHFCSLSLGLLSATYKEMAETVPSAFLCTTFHIMSDLNACKNALYSLQEFFLKNFKM